MKPVVAIHATRGEDNSIIPQCFDETLDQSCGCGLHLCHDIYDGDAVCANSDRSNNCCFYNGIDDAQQDGLYIDVICSCPLSSGFACEIKLTSDDIQQITYSVFDLIEPAIKQAIAHVLEKHL